MFRYMIILALAIPWSLIGYVLLSIAFMNWILLFIVSSAAGAVIYSLHLSVLESRFRSSTVNEQFNQIIELAHERVGSYGLVHVWQRRSPEPYIASTFNSLFNAVIVSEPMVELILKMRASGEALLAFHLLHRPNHRNILDIVAAMLIFSGFSTYMAHLLLVYPQYYTPYFMLILLASSMGVLFIVPVIFVLLLRGALWAHDSAFERAAGMYKIHPQVARDEVLSSAKLDEEAAKAVVWTVKEWERRKRDGRRSSITVMVLSITYFVIFYSLIIGGWYFYALSSALYYLVLVVPLLLALSVYLILRRWDKICMEEIYHEVTKGHEPIWAD
jgi:hypothetical protein